ncbi:hypothetical protein GNX71_16000 [Variovorax sp. RKNM96]|uniref:hypothetical protein n=1 Tax=Variovorax sp. RKNM96 TaxID=2681552 RepID=UPI0019800DD7|nr:hypothetical protein [Variovorax sp. RKNM96]QSI30997.1 hypothetical protein GNX71_16000 [Variovorax sp. RKNM96]
MTRRTVLPLLLLFASAPCFAAWSIETDRSTAKMHGLFEIREEARSFVAKENAATRSGWEALDPNLKILVPRCSVPLETKWTPHSYGLTGRNVMVSCARTVGTPQKWNVNVPVTRKK